MFSVIMAADFPLQNTGITSTATGILANIDRSLYTVYADRPLVFNGSSCESLRDFRWSTEPTAIFSHMEYSRLRWLLRHLPRAMTHVGDWPALYWRSLARSGRPVKGTLGHVRMSWRIRGLPRDRRYLFVTERDSSGAKDAGFQNALHLPIGVASPSGPRGAKLDTSSVCFSGNFRFAPNREAALPLIDWARSNPDFQLHLVGFHAMDFQSMVTQNVRLHDSVRSVVDFLSELRPIYVSPLRTGAGAKNKILEALVAGCPILCTEESLDESVAQWPSIVRFTELDQLRALAEEVRSSSAQWLVRTDTVAAAMVERRGWANVSARFLDLLAAA